MEIGNLWLIPVSIIFNRGLYLLLKHYLVNWFCIYFLSKSVILECTLKKKLQSINGANGYVKPSEKPSEKDYYGGRKLVTNGEVATVSMEMVGSVIAAVTALVSILVMIETRHDSLNARSPLLIPWTHIAAWYFVVDLYSMYNAFCLKRNIYHLPLTQRCYMYVRAKLPYVLHHVILFIFGYQLVVNERLRGYRGDFYIASVFVEDLSNPFVNTAKILKLLGQEKTTFYLVNGFFLVVIFFTVRFLNVPFSVIVYAAQNHNWNIWKAISCLKLVCFVSIGLMYALQTYWFILILKLTAKGLAGMKKTTKGLAEMKKTTTPVHKAKAEDRRGRKMD